jgi:PIN domain nuclease of toxin-antitoxin system
MKVLLDTNELFWYLIEDSKDSKMTLKLRDFLDSGEQDVYYSPISIYEMWQKFNIGKWGEVEPIILHYKHITRIANVGPLSFTPEDGDMAGKLKWGHKDPFDRMLVAQALNRGYSFATEDYHIIDLPILDTIHN